MLTTHAKRSAAALVLATALSACHESRVEQSDDPDVRTVLAVATSVAPYVCAVTREPAPDHLRSEATHVGVCVTEDTEPAADLRSVDCTIHRVDDSYVETIEIHAWHEGVEEPAPFNVWEEAACTRAVARVRPWVDAEIAKREGDD